MLSGRRHGRLAMGAVSGFLFGFCVSLLLLTLGHVAVNSLTLFVVPILFLVAGAAWAIWAPLRRRPPSAFAPPPRRSFFGAAASVPPAPPQPVPLADATDAPQATDAVSETAAVAPPVVVPELSGDGVDESGSGGGPV